MLKKLLFYSLFVQCVVRILAVESQVASRASISDEEFIEKYSVDKSVQASIDEHVDDINKKMSKCDDKACSYRHPVWLFDWLPEYVIKFNIGRICGAEIVRRCITEHKLDLLSVPDKRLYHIRGKPKNLTNENYLVVVPRIAKKVRQLTLEEIKQLCILMKETGDCDLNRENYFFRDNLIIIIDTEITDFQKGNYLRALSVFFNTNYQAHRDFREDVLRYIFMEMISCIPTTDKSEYKRIRRQVGEWIERQQRPYAWDFKSFFELYFPILED